MYIVRDIFYLKFGMFRDAIAAVKIATAFGLLTVEQVSVLSDFTGDAYRLIIETSYNTMAEYEQNLTQGMKDPNWQTFYNDFKPLIIRSHREILKKHQIT
jgi:hypothetical protein